MLVFGRVTKFGSFEKVNLLEGAVISDENWRFIQSTSPAKNICGSTERLQISWWSQTPRSLLIIGGVLKMSATFFRHISTTKNKQLRWLRRQNAVRPMAGDPFSHLESPAIDAFHDALQLIQPGRWASRGFNQITPVFSTAMMLGILPYIHSYIYIYVYIYIHIYIYICVYGIYKSSQNVYIKIPICKSSLFQDSKSCPNQTQFYVCINLILSSKGALWDAPTDRIRRTLRNHLGASASPCPSTAPDESTSAPRRLDTSLLPVIRAPSDLVIRGPFECLLCIYIYIHVFPQFYT